MGNKKIILFTLIAVFFFIFHLSYSQRVITTNIDWSTHDQFMWGPNGSTFFMNQTVPIFNTQNLLPPSTNSLDFTTSVPFLGRIGVVITIIQDFIFAAQLTVQGFHTGYVDVDYPVKIDLTFPNNQTFNPGQFFTINSNYIVRPGWRLDTRFPETGRIGFDFVYGVLIDVNADIYTGFGTQSTIDMITINVPRDTFPLFEIDNSQGVATTTYPCGINWNLQLTLCHDTLLPIRINFPTIGLTGTITIPFVVTEDRLDAPTKCLIAEGDSDYVHLRLDIIQFIWAISDTSIRNMLDILQGTIDIVPNFITVNYDLLNAYFLVTNRMKQRFTYCPEVMAKLTFPVSMEYNVTDPANGSVWGSGNSNVMEFPVDDNLNVKYPCNGFDFMDVGMEYYIREDNNFCNKTWDEIQLDFELDALTFTVSILNIITFPTIGPLIDLHIPIATIPTFTWFDQCWNLKELTPQINGRPDTIVPGTSITPDDTMHTYLSGISVLCFGMHSGSVIVNVEHGSPPFNYLWSTGRNITRPDRADTLTVVGHGTYSVTVTDASGCISTQTIHIDENPEILYSHFVTDVRCEGDYTGAIAETITGGTPGYTYYWTPTGQTGATAINLHSGIYDVLITDAVGCQTIDSNIVVIDLYPKPPAYFIPDITSGCQPLVVYFDETSPDLGQRYYWDFGDGETDTINKDPIHVYNNDGFFEVTLTTISPQDCDSIFIFRNIEVYPKPNALFNAEPVTIKRSIDPSFMITFTDLSTDAALYSWNFGDTASASSNYSSDRSPIHYYNQDCDGLYTVTLIVTSDHNCKDTVTKQIEIIDDILTFPNVITPNADGHNDRLEIVNVEKFPKSRLRIYNRWGKKVFESTGYKNDWNPDELSGGTYYFVFEYGIDRAPVNGTFTIIRQ